MFGKPVLEPFAALVVVAAPALSAYAADKGPDASMNVQAKDEPGPKPGARRPG